MGSENDNAEGDLPPLTAELVLWGYRRGLFPMADHQAGPTRWYSPDPRAVIDLDAFHIPRTLRQRTRQKRFDVTMDRDFSAVIRACADRRPTWISDEIISVYTTLHVTGYAHSVEVWREGNLAGGLYGVVLGAAFFGESMFHAQADASKVALVALVQQLRRQQFTLLDTQYLTAHLARFGASTIPRDEYLQRLNEAIALDRRFRDDDDVTITLDV